MLTPLRNEINSKCNSPGYKTLAALLLSLHYAISTGDNPALACVHLPLLEVLTARLLLYDVRPTYYIISV